MDITACAENDAWSLAVKNENTPDCCEYGGDNYVPVNYSENDRMNACLHYEDDRRIERILK